MNATITHIDKVRQEIASTRALIMELCGFTKDELSELIFNSAFEYLKDVLGVDAYGIEELPKHQLFWGWWELQWHKVDAIFLDRLRFDTQLGKYTCTIPHKTGQAPSTFLWVLNKPAQFQVFYHLYHRISTDNIYMNSAVMEAGYHKLIKRMAVEGREVKGE